MRYLPPTVITISDNSVRSVFNDFTGLSSSKQIILRQTQYRYRTVQLRCTEYLDRLGIPLVEVYIKMVCWACRSTVCFTISQENLVFFQKTF